MAVYVDNYRVRYRHMVMCHMLADTTEELHEMADRIGLDRRWVQFPGTWREHYDISLSRRSRALAAGAIPITVRDVVRILRERRKAM